MIFNTDYIKEDTDDSANKATSDYLASLTQNGVPPHAFTLKQDCICTIMRNLSVQKGLVKNTRVVVRNLHRCFVEVQLIDHSTNALSETHCIPRIRFKFEPTNANWTVLRLQFPLCLAYACTFHGCVGLTLDWTVLDQRTQVFAHGQLYTALSRVRHRAHSKLPYNEEDEEASEHISKNVVYKNLLL
jgi:hypothetical protein